MRFRRRCLTYLIAGLLTAVVYAAGAQASHSDQGAARSSQAAKAEAFSNIKLERMLLLLRPAETQYQSLDKLLAAQITPGNAQYHHWVSPDEFAQRFAPSMADASAVAGWLRGQGFVVAALPLGRAWVEFSGTVAQAQRAFGVPVQEITSATGEVRFRLGGEAKFPAAISSKVVGLASLDGSLAVAAATEPLEMSVATGQLHPSLMNPSRMRAWLHLPSPTDKDATGAGETIAIPSRSSVRAEDFTAFRSSFALPEMALEVRGSGDTTSDEAATIAAASWAGVIAPGARIVVIPAASTNATDGIDLALAAALEARDDSGGPLANTISVGYASCESGMSAAHQQFYAALYRQAAAEGVAMIAATGDSGAAACDIHSSAYAMSGGFAVNGLASTSWNTAVGAISFTADGKSLSSWQPAHAGDPAYATGGGASAVYATPTWQSATGMPDGNPANHMARPRYLPDVSLPSASGESRGLAFCFAGQQAVSDPSGCRRMSAGGSAVSAAIFSGMAALLAEKYGPQGNLAPNLYAIGHHEAGDSKTSSQRAIIDVTAGSAKLRCVPGSPDCVASSDGIAEIGFDAAPGYDLASGLGSIDAGALITEWANPEVTGTAPVSVVMTTIGGTTYNPSAIIALTAKVVSGSGGSVPTGTVQFYDETVGGNTGAPATLDSQGNATYSENGQFTVGGHNIVAIYSGDSTYQSATSQPITINIQPSPTTLTVSSSSLTPVGGSTITVTGRVIATNPGAQPPTGALTINLDGIAQGTTALATTGSVTSGTVMVTVPTAGSHTLQGFYGGDINYNNSTSSSITIIVSKTATTTSLSATPATLTAGVPETFSAVIAPVTAVTGASYNITGTVSFYDGGTSLLGIAPVTGNTAILAGISLTPTVVHTITAVYSGDTTFGTSTSAPLVLEPVLLPVTVTLTSSNTVLAPGQSANLTATVQPVNTPVVTAEQHPTGTIYFYAGTTLLGSASLVAGVGDTSTATIAVPVLPAGAYVLTAVYSGDLTFGPATSNSLNLNVQDFTVTCSLNNVSVVQGQSVTIGCIVSSLGGLMGPIALACAEQNPPQVGAMGCYFNPTSIEGNGTSDLTITTTAGGTTDVKTHADSRRTDRHGGIWRGAGGLALAFGGLLLSPIGRRAPWLRQSGRRTTLMLAILLAGIASSTAGCNSGTNLSSLERGTPLGVHTIKITAAADLTPPTVTVSHYAYVTVNVTPQ